MCALGGALGHAWPTGIVVIVVVGVMGAARLARSKPLATGAKVAALGVDLAAMAACSLLDSSWVSGLSVGVVGAMVMIAWVLMERSFLASRSLSGATRSALGRAGVHVGDEAVAGWSVGASAAGTPILLREAVGVRGRVEEWPEITRAVAGSSAVAAGWRAQGAHVHFVVVAAGYSGRTTSVDGVHVCSPARLGELVRTLDAAMAKDQQDGERTAGRARKSKSGTVVHQGRVTRRVN
jgi:hypothetical protein